MDSTDIETVAFGGIGPTLGLHSMGLFGANAAEAAAAMPSFAGAALGLPGVSLSVPPVAAAVPSMALEDDDGQDEDDDQDDYADMPELETVPAPRFMPSSLELSSSYRRYGGTPLLDTALPSRVVNADVAAASLVEEVESAVSQEVVSVTAAARRRSLRSEEPRVEDDVEPAVKSEDCGPAAADTAEPPLRRSTRHAALAARIAIQDATKSREHVRPSSSEPPTKKRRMASLKSPPSEAVSPKKRSAKANLKTAPSDDTAKAPPANAKNDADYEVEVENAVSCCICMCEPEHVERSSVDGCEHKFCFGCISKWADRENTCPLCKARFTKITRENPGKRKKGAPQNSRKVAQRDQRSDLLSGAALEGLLQSLASARSLNMNIGFPLGFVPSARSRFTFSLEDALHRYTEEESTLQISLTNRYSRGGFAAGRPTFPAAAAAMSVAARMHQTEARSFASNGNDRTAGSNSVNPLVIDDDEDDDEVEVVRVARS